MLVIAPMFPNNSLAYFLFSHNTLRWSMIRNDRMLICLALSTTKTEISFYQHCANWREHILRKYCNRPTLLAQNCELHSHINCWVTFFFWEHSSRFKESNIINKKYTNTLHYIEEACQKHAYFNARLYWNDHLNISPISLAEIETDIKRDANSIFLTTNQYFT